jgi:Trk K+ transport system NAD-binding subunit
MKQNLGEQVIGAVGSAITRVFSSKRDRMILVGANPITHLVASELNIIGNRAVVVSLETDMNPDSQIMDLERTTSTNGFDKVVLEDAGAGNARCLLAVTPDYERNIGLCRTAIEGFQVPTAIARKQSTLDGAASWIKVSGYGVIQIAWL